MISSSSSLSTSSALAARKAVIKSIYQGGDNEFLAIIIIQELASVRCKLPVHKYEDIIVTSVVNNNVTILVGDTGSGKTTQVPQYLYKYRNKITNKQFREVITQPRRVAATTVASRVAEEMGTILGEGVVGYAVRFDDNTNHRTRIKFCTDGILLREAVVDPTLSRYTVVIIDEIHERSLYTDTVLGLVSNALVDVKLRDNIKVVLMSATVVADKFKEYFLQSGCSVNTVVVPGRTYPVALYYTPTPEVDFLEAAQLTIIQILLGIEDDNLIHGRSRRDGDILVFLPGVDNILSLHASLERVLPTLKGLCTDNNNNTELKIKICDLYSSQSKDKQKEAFIPSGVNEIKIILSTNIAETSVTISGVTTVIDTGLAKTRVFDTLRISPISKASASQRSGRAGRERPGVCYRLYPEIAYEKEMIQHSIPEILRSDMSYVLLQLLAMGVVGGEGVGVCHNLIDFPFVDKPSPKRIRMASRLLRRIGAIGSDLSSPILTSKGRRMAQYPLEPLISNILVTEEEKGKEEDNNNCLAEILTLVSMLSTDNIFLSSGNIRESKNSTAWFMGLDTRSNDQISSSSPSSSKGDHVCLVELYNTWKRVPTSSVVMWCNKRNISHNAMLKARSIRTQVKDILSSSSISIGTCGPDWSILRRAICRGLWPNTYQRVPDSTTNNNSSTLAGVWYTPIVGAGINDKAQVSPMSVTFTLPRSEAPEVIVTNEIVTTTRAYMRYITPIQLDWLSQDQPQYFTTTTT